LAITLDAVDVAAQSPSAGPAKVDLNSDFVQSTIREAKETLETCNKLIAHNHYFQKSKDGYITNIVWALTIADHVRQQQARVQVCFHRANFVLQRTAEGSFIWGLGKIQEEINWLIEYLQPSNLHPGSVLVSSEIAECFVQSYQEAASEVIPTVSQRLDAVQSFYESSTKDFREEEPFIVCPSPVQYLNLLKCIWLLDQVKSDRGFRLHCEDPFNVAYARSLDRKVTEEAQRFLQGEHPLARVSDDQLLRQDTAAFNVGLWKPIEVPMPGPLEANGGEVLLMRTVLKARDPASVEELRVFGIAEGRLRLARATTKSNHSQYVDITIHEREIDSRKVFLSPVYAMTLDAASSVIWKPATSDQTVQELPFATLRDALKFQALVTAFGVAYTEHVLSEAKKKANIIDGQGKIIGQGGHVQIWMHRSPLAAPSVESTIPGSASGGSRSTGSGAGSGEWTSISKSTWIEAEIRSRNRITTIMSGQGGAFLTEPVPGQIMLLTEVGDSKRVVAIPITEHTRLAPEKCRCSSKKGQDQCREVVVESDKGKIKIKTSRVLTQNEGWNVAVFGQPRHKDSKQVEEESIRYVSLRFQSVDARKGFAESAGKACNIMRNRVDAYHRDLRETRKLTVYNTR